MNKIALMLAGTVGLASAPAYATLTVNLSLPSGTFDNPNVNCVAGAPCPFSDTVTFSTPVPYNLLSASITTIAVNGVGSTSDINFTSVILDGNAFTLSPQGFFEFGSLANIVFVAPGNHTLTVNGQTFGLPGNDPATGLPRDSSYSGTLTFAARTAVPETATWLSTLLGFGVLGFAMRRGTIQSRRVIYDLG
jgi:hypothetical protein